ncbi:MAG: hypothetical protein F4145_03020 [Boseongicola sp. SB0675_bin_26]|nr:hypothetical protein [Boseongicola sp. SB0675_bin_26]
MTDRHVLRNECEQAMLQLENAFLKCMGESNSKRWFNVSGVADELAFGRLILGYHTIDGAALGRAIAERLEHKKLVEIERPIRGPWKIRRTLGPR